MQLFYFQNNPVDNPEITYQVMLEVFVKSLVMFALAIVTGRLVCRIFPSYNETKKDWELGLEIAMQTGLNGMLIYLAKELVEYIGRALIGPTSSVASSYSYVVFALGLFSVQSEMKKKILHLITGEKQINNNIAPNPSDEDLEYEDEQPNNQMNNGDNLSLNRNLETLQQQQGGQPMPPTVSSQVLGQQYRMPTNDNNNNDFGENKYNFTGETPLSNLNLNNNNNNNNNNNYMPQQNQNQLPPLQPPQFTQQQDSNCANGSCSSGMNKDTNFGMNTEALRNYDNSDGYCASGKKGCSAGKWSDTQISNESPMGDVMAFGSALGGAPLF